MRLDEFVDMAVQPQQDMEVQVEVNGELFDVEVKNEGGKFIIKKAVDDDGTT